MATSGVLRSRATRLVLTSPTTCISWRNFLVRPPKRISQYVDEQVKDGEELERKVDGFGNLDLDGSRRSIVRRVAKLLGS